MGGNRLASNSLIEAVVYADAAAKHAMEVKDHYTYRHDVPEWNDEGTRHPEEMVLITQSIKEVGQIMSTYVGIVRSDLRLKRACIPAIIISRKKYILICYITLCVP